MSGKTPIYDVPEALKAANLWLMNPMRNLTRNHGHWNTSIMNIKQNGTNAIYA